MESGKPEENPAEPVPDVVGAAEPAQPVESEETPAEFEAEIIENPNQDTGGTSSTADNINEAENLSTADNINEAENLSTGATDEKVQLRKKASISSKRDTKEKHKDGEGSVIQSSPSEEFGNRQSQTFFKYMKNLTDYRCAQILNQEVDHGNSELIFYVSSKDLLYNIDILDD